MENGTSIYRRKINYYETDCMGIVHHSNYIRFFEEARLDMMEKCGLGYRQIEEMNLIIPVTYVDCQYIKPLKFDDAIRIESHFTRYNGIKMEVSYEIYREDTGELCTSGRSGHCFLNRDMKPVRMKRAFPEIYQKLSLLTGKTCREK